MVPCLQAVGFEKGVEPLKAVVLRDVCHDAYEVDVAITPARVSAVEKAELSMRINAEIAEVRISMNNDQLFRLGNGSDETIVNLLSGQAAITLIKVLLIHSVVLDHGTCSLQANGERFTEGTKTNVK